MNGRLMRLRFPLISFLLLASLDIFPFVFTSLLSHSPAALLPIPRFSFSPVLRAISFLFLPFLLSLSAFLLPQFLLPFILPLLFPSPFPLPSLPISPCTTFLLSPSSFLLPASSFFLPPFSYLLSPFSRALLFHLSFLHPPPLFLLSPPPSSHSSVPYLSSSPFSLPLLSFPFSLPYPLSLSPYCSLSPPPIHLQPVEPHRCLHKQINTWRTLVVGAVCCVAI